MKPLVSVQTVVEKGVGIMRSLFIFVWCTVILIFTCTSSFHDLIQQGVLRFRWDGDPTFSDFLSPLPYVLSKGFLLQKLGHIVVFQVLTILLLMKFRSHMIILAMTASFASLTEILQLYFSRGGRAFDIGFDLIGILLTLAIANILRIKHSSRIDLNN
ncbi:VanZ family protein [Neobacillus sp. DY30]|uniref:VanZ family protein n=1 Tax=Neobacillus sp. DY30 TaxID=3047871 RepID=UPI0024C00B23|nr:VanZ family protein [Neobacillus sp. DY30]WHY00045.1 VanZ family protein [Neobacillus sp. DY30]